jgi:predicted  nucleic acid-binding Zn-ribbon protein
MNLAQLYVKQSQELSGLEKQDKLELALEKIRAAELSATVPQKNNADVNYRAVILSEILADLAELIKSPDEKAAALKEAFAAAKKACSHYSGVKTDLNLLRAQIAQLNAAISLVEDARELDAFLSEIKNHAKELKLTPEHDLAVRIEQLEGLMFPHKITAKL